MSNKTTKHKPTAAGTPSRAQAAADGGKQKKGRFLLSPRKARTAVYLLGFALLFAFLYWGYGDVLARAEQDSYISTSPDAMAHLLRTPLGHVYWLTRWALLPFRWAALGALLLAIVYTLTARLADYTLRLPRTWEGAGFLLPLVQIGWMAWRGTNLYYKNEPSLFVLIALAVLAAVALLALAVWLMVRKAAKKEAAPVRPLGLAGALVLIAAVAWAVCHFNQNVILTARLQNLCAQHEWEKMIDEARSARQPSRSVAVYHAIALEETDQLLEGMFDIVYEYPKLQLDSIDGNEEYGIFLQDVSYHAGLTNVAYRTAMDHMVMNGPRLSALKHLAVSALVNGEEALSRKYLSLIAQTPFEGSFVKYYTRLLDDPKLQDSDPEIVHVRSLAPRENKFEQNYPAPAFLGYNMILLEGTDATLRTAVAACLYSKDLQQALPRIQVMAQKGWPLPASVQQALCILNIKRPDLKIQQSFPQISRYLPQELNSFLIDAKPYAKDRLALRHELRKQWLGTYFYYYYTENNDPDQVTKEPEKGESAVN